MVVLGAARRSAARGSARSTSSRALQECGYDTEAERVLAMLGARVHGDHLQTAAIFDESMRVLSLVTDPNDYAGPGTGYEPSQERRAEIDAIRQARGVEDLRADQAQAPATCSGWSAPRPGRAIRARWSSACRRASAARCG